ncbi:MAG: hypothetical protein R2827_16110 [Bdellovibrionales bacterium]
MFFLSVSCLFFMPFFIDLYLVRRFKSQFAEKLLLFLDSLLLKMRVGAGFRSAMSVLLHEKSDLFSITLKKIMDYVVFSQQDSSKLPHFIPAELVTEFIFADKAPHLAFSRIENYRNRLKSVENFRRKSHQVTINIRYQMLVLSGLFVFLMWFSIQKFGYLANSRIFMSSALLYLIGIGVSHRIYKGWKWKI